jgi:hypothetical protein
MRDLELHTLAEIPLDEIARAYARQEILVWGVSGRYLDSEPQHEDLMGTIEVRIMGLNERSGKKDETIFLEISIHSLSLDNPTDRTPINPYELATMAGYSTKNNRVAMQVYQAKDRKKIEIEGMDEHALITRIEMLPDFMQAMIHNLLREVSIQEELTRVSLSLTSVKTEVNVSRSKGLWRLRVSTWK